jgi:hypothetical protein
VDLEHACARMCLRQRDVDALVKAPPYGLVQVVRQVGGAKHQHTRAVVAVDALHLYHELRLDAPRCLGLVVTTCAAAASAAYAAAGAEPWESKH